MVVNYVHDGLFATRNWGYDKAVDSMGQERVEHLAQTGCVLLRTGEEYRVALVMGHILDPVGNTGEELVGNIVRYDGYGI